MSVYIAVALVDQIFFSSSSFLFLLILKYHARAHLRLENTICPHPNSALELIEYIGCFPRRQIFS